MGVGPGDIRWRRELLSAGFASGEVRGWVRRRELVAVGRGAYVPGGSLPVVPEARHALAVHAAVPGLASDAVVSHVSAAVLHSLPVWAIPLERVHVTRPRRSGARVGPALHMHAARLDADEVVHVGGLAVTSVARTIVDIARSVSFEAAVPVADGALHRKIVTPGELDAAVARSVRRPGTPLARRVVAFADGRSEGVGESRSRVRMAQARLPVPALQWEVSSRTGRWLGRVDFGWPELATVGEFDGRVKYGRLLRPGQDPGEVVFAEKVREDALRDEDLRVVRWTWHDLDNFDDVAARLRHAFRPR